jgi:CRISPR-associated protein Cmr1
MSQETLPRPPARLKRRSVRGPTLKAGTVELRTVTPVMGGAPETRKVDQVDFIRAPTIRGHLRFWWRALYAARWQDEKKLLEHERELWGGMGTDGGEPVRSQVELRVIKVGGPAKPDPSGIPKTEAYALWPADRSKAERWPPGLRFRLEWSAPERMNGRDAAQEVEAALRAWILFGGYGSRTRRGCGSLTIDGQATVNGQAQDWLPETPTSASLEKLFSHAGLRLESASSPARPTPSLHGAGLHLEMESESNAEAAWHKALGWLRDFRQGEAPPDEKQPEWFARAAGGTRDRPGRSRWPEPDKIRRLLKRSPKEHAPRYNEQPAWPRAGFGLPIQLKFQQQSRDERPYTPSEPGDDKGFMLLWSEGSTKHDRLASPLIVKPLPLTDGRFAPMALWLSRQLPEKAEVFLMDQQRKSRVRDSEAPFTRLHGDKEKALYEPLNNQKDLRSAFFHWLRSP